MKKIFFFGLIILILFLAGCDQVDVSKLSDADLQRIADKAIVCSAPYIRYSTGCCLDQNNNSICDTDETSKKQSIETSQEANKTSIPSINTTDCNSVIIYFEAWYDVFKKLQPVCLSKYGVDKLGSSVVSKDDKDCLLLLKSYSEMENYDNQYAASYKAANSGASPVVKLDTWDKETILSDCKVFNSFYDNCNDLNLVDKCVKKYGEDSIEAGNISEKDECYVQVLCSDLTGSKEYNAMKRKCSSRNLPDKCTLSSGVSCLDFDRTATGATLIIQNSAGFDMTSVQVKLKDSAGTVLTTCTSSSGSGKLTDGAKDTFTCSVSNMSDPFKASVELSYTNVQTSMSHTKTGELILYAK